MQQTALPAGFTTRMRQLIGHEADELFAALDSPRQPAVRLNTLRGAATELEAALPWPSAGVPWCPAGRAIAAESTEVAGSALNDAGVYYQQDPAAMLAGQSLAPRPGDLVVDVAAAPGGKSTHAAALMGDVGLVVANEVDERRARSLLGNVERLGITGAVVTNAPAERLPKALGARADCVLLDAPCSGEGMFRRSQAAREAWSASGVEANAQTQRRLIASAADLVRPGGRLVYSTCTFDPRENEEVVEWLLRVRDDFVLEPLSVEGGPGVAIVAGVEDSGRFGLPGAARVWPHLSPGDGHFVARLRREGRAGDGQSTDAGDYPNDYPTTDTSDHHAGPRAKRRREKDRGRPDWTPGREALVALDGFALEHLTPAWRERFAGGRLASFGKHLLLLPDRFEALRGVHVLRAGLHLGDTETRGRRQGFVPAHALAMAAGFGRAGWAGQRLELRLGSPDLAVYLAGGQVETPGHEAGPILVTHGGFALGWGLCKGGVTRSLLPKGLRRTL